MTALGTLAVAPGQRSSCRRTARGCPPRDRARPPQRPARRACRRRTSPPPLPTHRARRSRAAQRRAGACSGTGAAQVPLRNLRRCRQRGHLRSRHALHRVQPRRGTGSHVQALGRKHLRRQDRQRVRVRRARGAPAGRARPCACRFGSEYGSAALRFTRSPGPSGWRP